MYLSSYIIGKCNLYVLLVVNMSWLTGYGNELEQYDVIFIKFKLSLSVMNELFKSI